MITKCNMLAWVGPGPEREQRLCGTADNNEFSVHLVLQISTKFEIISK